MTPNSHTPEQDEQLVKNEDVSEYSLSKATGQELLDELPLNEFKGLINALNTCLGIIASRNLEVCLFLELMESGDFEDFTAFCNRMFTKGGLF